MLLALGKPVLHISAAVKPELLQEYMTSIWELTPDYAVQYCGGSAAQNSRCGGQWLLPPRSTVYLCCIGKDHKLEYLNNPEVSTGRCAMLITDIHPSVVTDLIANNHKMDHLKSPAVWAQVEHATHNYVEGYVLTVNAPSILAIAEHASNINKKYMVVFSVFSAPFILEFIDKRLDELLPYIDIVVGNEREAQSYADVKLWGFKDVAEMALKVAALPKVSEMHPRLLVLTQAASDTFVVQSGKVLTFPTIKISPAKIVDSNGAGDGFCRGFMFMEQSIATGHYVANDVVQRTGPTYPREAQAISFVDHQEL
ncbi:Ribokinase-like protein [Blyttiomyces helicus]|uniref:Adenosine kinase n=1 Tax=Blyttiomyces helicus TaxID=388810 RepID=A0A4P9W4T5_9FUNG|nr:Ribokinase-like protein [Blyttiomyces helicus]|eukprot:RKO85730.1 Ribokinase-like protein [Blyttiomyces helicus]